MDILISAILALLIHLAPIALKLRLDPLYHLNSFALITLLAIVFLQVALLILPGKKWRILGTLVLLPLILSTVLNFLSLAIFASPISLSGVVSIVQSNPAEALEFTEAYRSIILLTLGSSLIVFSALLYFYLKSPKQKTYRVSAMMAFTAVIFAGPLLSKAVESPKLAAWDLHEVIYADRLVTSLLRYRGQMVAWNKERARWQNRGDVAQGLELKIEDKSRLAPLVIVIIGESTTRNHFSLYGYPRETTPKLESMRDDLIVFDDVITPTAHTIPAVMGALCSEKLKAGEINCNAATLIDIARGAGYKVSWISNQTQIGFDDSSIVHLGRSADKSIFVNQDVSSAGEADRNVSLDAKVLAPLKSIIANVEETGEMNMVFIHLMGAHFTYEKRYPEEMKMFRDSTALQLSESIKDPQAESIINHYDNAIAYQDELLSEIFSTVKKSSKPALSLYFSDHGEEVYSSKNFHGHSDDNLTPSMSEVPFILSVSDSYRVAQERNVEILKGYSSRPFITSQLTPSLSNLLGIRYRGLKDEKSLFSKTFEPELRKTAKGPYEPKNKTQLGQR
jgi:heptose-I-phosphate ethanolaminephosphotransferase